MSTQVMKFGIKRLWSEAKTEQGNDLAREHMFLAHQYYNELIALGRARNAKYREIRARQVQGLQELEAQVSELEARREAIVQEIRSRRKAKRTKNVEDADLRERLKSMKTELEEPYKRLKKLRASFEPMLRDAQDELSLRCSKVPQLVMQIRELGRQIKEAKRDKQNQDVAKLKRTHSELKKRRKKEEHGPRVIERIKHEALDQMLSEPEWSLAWKEVARMDAEHLVKTKAARANCGIPQGTYSAVENAVKQAFTTCKAGDPSFRKVDVVGPRKIGVQLKGKPTWTEILNGEDTFLQARYVNLCEVERKGPNKQEVSNRKGWFYARVKLRIGTTEGKPVWCEADVTMHRAPPSDARISWAYLVPKRIGFRTVYSLQLTVETERPLINRDRGEGECVVRLCWSKQEDGEVAKESPVKVAEINGEPFVVPQQILALLALRESLQSASDKIFDGKKGTGRGARQRVQEWILKNRNLAPDWLLEETKFIDRWRSHRRLHRIAKRWASEQGVELKKLWREWMESRDALKAQFPRQYDVGDYYTDDPELLKEWLASQGITGESQVMAVWLEWCGRKDMHILQWAEDERSHALNRRKDFYRCKAAELSRCYDKLVLYELDLSGAAKRKPTEDDEDEMPSIVRWRRTAVAPSQFKECLKLAFGSDRFEIRKRERSPGPKNPGGARDSEKHAKNEEPIAAE